MILVDVNLLIYATDRDAASHLGAKDWLETVMSGNESVGFSWSVLLAFLRLTTRPGLFRKPLSIKQAFEVMDSWLDQPVAVILHPGNRHLNLLREMLLTRGTGGNLTSDAHLAALAIEHEAQLFTSDNDFARFRGLRWGNPLN